MLFNRRKELTNMPFLSGILDSQDIDIIITDEECNTLLINTAARTHLEEEGLEEGCADGFSVLFPGLCKFCPFGEADVLEEPVNHDVTDHKGRAYYARFSSIDWADGSPATVMFIRKVEGERSTWERLYSLAYIDQLTGIANRRRLKEDFESMAESQGKGAVRGVLAIFDLDNFKAINDSYGHGTGDIMLKRLTGHFESDEAFRGHLYRLGGDEFVLLFMDPIDRFPSPDDYLYVYGELLRGALGTYTLPNIDASCTLSMGVSFFPLHSDYFSELLRKADIALYKAKESGRNRICYFEEKDDTAKKFKDLFISFQPILATDNSTYAYELVDQDYAEEKRETTLFLHEFDRTMEALSLDDLESDTLYVISFSNQLLNPAVAANLPIRQFIVQVRIGGQIDEKDIKKIQELRELGYSLALSGLNSANCSPELLSLADYCKFDPEESDMQFRRLTILENPAIRFIATRMDEQDAFEAAKKQGFVLFQGFYFQQPSLVKQTKEIDPLKVNYLRLLRLTSTDDYVDFQEISTVISSDVALSYKLLRMLNSAAVGLRNRISSISMAVTYLGEVNLKKWIAMLALRGLAEDKPMELIRLSLIRARFGESLCEMMLPKRNPKHIFLLGLLSLLNIALDKGKEEVFREIAVATEISDSLLTNDGPHSDMLKFLSDYEYANWEEVAAFVSDNQMTDSQVNNAYITAIKWYNDMLKGESLS